MENDEMLWGLLLFAFFIIALEDEECSIIVGAGFACPYNSNIIELLRILNGVKYLLRNGILPIVSMTKE